MKKRWTKHDLQICKQYLKQVDELEWQMEQRIAQIKHLRQTRTQMRAITYRADKIQTSMSGDGGFESEVLKLYELEKDAWQLARGAEQTRDMIISQIEGMSHPGPWGRQVLQLRYIEGMTLEQISFSLYISLDLVNKAHRQGVESFLDDYGEMVHQWWQMQWTEDEEDEDDSWEAC